MKPKSLIFGIDGGNFQTLKPWIEEGSMPFLKHFLENNYSAEIQCEKDMSPGWPTFITGKKPENHLGYYWMGRNIHARRDKFIVNSSFLGSETLWHTLSKNKISCALINVPFTYPPPQINGFVISGPGGGLKYDPNLEITYPESLMSEIKSQGIEYKMKWLDVNSNQGATEYIERIIKATESHIAAAKYLLNNYNIDLLMIVFRGHDSIQHRTCRLIDNGKIQLYDSLYKSVQKYYMTIDKGMMELYEYFNNNFDLFTSIVSDHGFGPCHLMVNTDQFLKMKGWNYNGYGTLMPKIISKIAGTKNPAIKGFMDFRKTKAYLDSTNSISLNVKDRDPYGTIHKDNYYNFRDEVISFLLEQEHPKYGKIFKKILTPESLNINSINFKKYSKYFPDIIFSPNDLVYIHGGFMLRNFDYNKPYLELKNKGFYNWTGTHRELGIFSFKTSMNNRTSNIPENMDLTCLAPSILNFFDVPVPNWMDGNSFF